MPVFWIAGEKGACIVEQEDLGHEKITYEALLNKSWRLGCNPGGAVTIYGNLRRDFPQKWFNRLLTKEDIAELTKELESNQ